jgi:hypothetical protein
MMPRIIGLIFIVSFQPVVKRGHLDSWTIFDRTSTNLLNSLADGDFWVDWLHGNDNVVFFERIEVLIEKSIDEDDIS